MSCIRFYLAHVGDSGSTVVLMAGHSSGATHLSSSSTVPEGQKQPEIIKIKHGSGLSDSIVLV